METYEPILRIDNLKVAFYRKKREALVIEDITLKLLPGKILGLVGESGCGKSMTALSILRLLPGGGKITGGEIYFKNKNMLALSKQGLRQIRGKSIGMVFQDPNTSLNPVRTIGSQFIETLQTHLALDKPKCKVEAESMLTAMGLACPEQIMRRYSFQLSGGMRQRIMIAMALALKPDVLIADEPTTALDVTIQAQILLEMKKLQQVYGTSILLISHNMGVIAQLCDDVAVMYGGKIVETGTVEQVYFESAHPYTQGLLHSIPKLNQKESQKLVTIKGQPPNPGELLEGCSFAPRCKAVKKVCYHYKPNLQNIKGNHKAACHFPVSTVQQEKEYGIKEVISL